MQQISFRNQILSVGSGFQPGSSLLLQTQAPCPEIQGVSDLFVSAQGSDALAIKLLLVGSFACACLTFISANFAPHQMLRVPFSHTISVAFCFKYFCVNSDSIPRLTLPSISLPDSRLIDASPANSVSRWWSGILQMPAKDVGSIVELRFQCSGFNSKSDKLRVYGQGDASTSAVLCGKVCSSAADTVCKVQGSSKVHFFQSFKH